MVDVQDLLCPALCQDHVNSWTPLGKPILFVTFDFQTTTNDVILITTERNIKLYLVKLFIKLAQLGDLLHDLLPHEERRVEHGVLLAIEDPQGVINESLFQEHQRSLNTTDRTESNFTTAAFLVYKSGSQRAVEVVRLDPSVESKPGILAVHIWVHKRAKAWKTSKMHLVVG